MNNYPLIILTGEKHSGKTTALKNWCKTNDCAGILSPIENNERVFFNLKTNQTFKMLAVANELNTLQIGPYVFSEKAFQLAIKIIENAISSEAHHTIIIDEVGPLELSQKGFDVIIKKLFSLNNLVAPVILVIRNTLVNDCIEQYSLHRFNPRIISITDL
jgi:nucleoside-triphosphatase THEP1